MQPQKLYHTAIRIMQESLDSDSLAIFRVDNGGQFARLVAASPRFDVGSFRSVRVSDYGEIITALEHNGIWVNRTLKDKFPMYAVGVRDRGELAVIITMGEAKPDQMNLYFQNLFSIMCGLVESAMIRAFEYEDVARRSMLVPGTNLLKPEAFLPKVLAANDLKHDHMGDHLLLKVECEGNLEDVDSLLMQSIRQTDEAGMLTDDGVYLLMNQAGEKELPIILKRLTRSGLHCSYVPQTQEDALLSEAQSHIAQADDGGES